MDSPRNGRKGFGLIELVTALAIVAILAAIALPSYQKILVRFRAASVVADFHAVRTAAYTYEAEHGEWPPDASRGIVPTGLQPYLGSGFSFVRSHYTLDWDAWDVPDGKMLGIAVIVPDPRLGVAVRELLANQSALHYLGDRYTFFIEGG